MDNNQVFIEDHMMAINLDALAKRDVYGLLSESVTPRPIAFVGTLNENGTHNAAPYSYFNVVSVKPPLVMVSIGKRQGKTKDTAANIRRTNNFTVNLVDTAMIERVNAASGDYKNDQSEVDLVGLHSIRSQSIEAPGIAESPVRFECEVERLIDLEDDNETTGVLVIGRIKRMQVTREGFTEGRIDAKKLDLVGRLGGNQYTKLGEVFELERPK